MSALGLEATFPWHYPERFIEIYTRHNEPVLIMMTAENPKAGQHNINLVVYGNFSRSEESASFPQISD